MMATNGCKHVGPFDASAARPFAGCVAPRVCRQPAHGNIVVTQTCDDCGAHREVAVNGMFREFDPWAVEG